jgi:hypothetical protein
MLHCLIDGCVYKPRPGGLCRDHLWAYLAWREVPPLRRSVRAWLKIRGNLRVRRENV